MIKRIELKKIARARIKDAEVLLKAMRYDGAAYICGYALELGLKARICQTLKWSGYPSTNKEFANYRCFKTHDLDVLLHLSGIEEKIKTFFFNDWSNVANWNPEARYEPIGTVSEQDAYDMIMSTQKLMKVL
ncbi:MAG: HEPN domain-containing protein [Candidatus Parabeggiatoa sp.]|nr:HEPN domain-containing protein [Candidatus Parabeggiatoa sp.]